MAEIKAYIDKIIGEVRMRPGVRSVGINGLDCAGKTTLANALFQACRSRGIEAKLLYVDTFNDKAVQSKIYAAYDAGGYSPDLQDIYYARSIHYVSLASAIKAEIAQGKGLVIVEGVFLFRPPIADILDFKVFLDVSAEQCRQNFFARKKHIGDPRPLSVFNDIWVPAFDRYCIEYNPKAQSDLVIEA